MQSFFATSRPKRSSEARPRKVELMLRAVCVFQFWAQKWAGTGREVHVAYVGFLALQPPDFALQPPNLAVEVQNLAVEGQGTPRRQRGPPCPSRPIFGPKTGKRKPRGALTQLFGAEPRWSVLAGW